MVLGGSIMKNHDLPNTKQRQKQIPRNSSFGGFNQFLPDVS
jgi:hypothetical protein